jgi:hypothetical protein
MNIIVTSLVLSCLTTGIIWKIKSKNNLINEKNNIERDHNEINDSKRDDNETYNNETYNNETSIYPSGPSFYDLNYGYMKNRVIIKGTREYVINL